jgi:hypothetical protein
MSDVSSERFQIECTMMKQQDPNTVSLIKRRVYYLSLYSTCPLESSSLPLRFKHTLCLLFLGPSKGPYLQWKRKDNHGHFIRKSAKQNFVAFYTMFAMYLNTTPTGSCHCQRLCPAFPFIGDILKETAATNVSGFETSHGIR